MARKKKVQNPLTAAIELGSKPFLIRAPAALLEAISIQAKRENRSVNSLICSLLQRAQGSVAPSFEGPSTLIQSSSAPAFVPFSAPDRVVSSDPVVPNDNFSGSGGRVFDGLSALDQKVIGQLVELVVQIVGAAFVQGIAVYGSVARGEMRATSDFDLLIVTDAVMKIEREHYRVLDEALNRSGFGVVSANLLHFPSQDREVTNLWLEVAQEAIILFDPNGELRAHFSLLRKQIIDRKYSRVEIHGQPYWKKVGS